jgi:hypothetical protein
VGFCDDGSHHKPASLSFADLLRDPTVLIEGVLFRARYLGSTQLVCEGQPTKTTRMMQAEEAVSRIKVSVRCTPSQPKMFWSAGAFLYIFEFDMNML